MTKNPWLQNAVFYEIYPTSFYDSNGDGVGDLQGIIQKLDYVKDLGCNGIWLNPCFTSPFKDGGYDISDYYSIDPRFGTNEDAAQLFEECHKRGIRILLDLVMGHTSDQHPWFQQSSLEKKNEYTNTYIWSDNMDVEHCEGRFMCGLSERPHMYKVNYYASQPALNYGYYKPTESWQMHYKSEIPMKNRKLVKDVCKFWLGMGCDGFRVDMAHSMVKNDPLHKGTCEFWNDVIPDVKKEFPQSIFLSEWCNPMKSVVKSSFDMDFYSSWALYFWSNHGRDDPAPYKETYFSEESRHFEQFISLFSLQSKPILKQGYYSISLGNHDTIRLSRGRNEDLCKALHVAHLTLPHVPLLYYGDEIGLPYQPLVSKDGGYHRTGSRTPMQWDNSQNLGFSKTKGELYLPVEADPDTAHTVKKQQQDASSLYHLVKKLAHLKQSLACLAVDSPFKILCTGTRLDGNPFIYRRESDSDEVVVILMPRSLPAQINLRRYLSHVEDYERICNNVSLYGDQLICPGEGFALFYKKL